MTNVIEVKNIKKMYQLYDKPISRLKEALSVSKKCYHTDFFALDNINFDVKKGECLGIIGTNGSGKSTLLKIITGVLNQTEGEVNVNGKISALLELGTGFNPEYTGIENIYLNGTMMGFSKKEIEGKVSQILDFAEIGDFINQPVKTYSSGMFARLAFAVAINVDPDILIVDEALSVGDIFFQSKCYRKFNEFKEKGKTIIFVSHDMGSILKYCDRTLLLHKGKQIELGVSSAVVDIYKKILVNQYDFSYDNNQGEVNDDKIIINDNNSLKKEAMTINPNYVEYGSKDAMIEDFAVLDHNNIITNSIYKGSEFKIWLKVKFNTKIHNPIFAYTIKDIKGTEITGTNSMLEGATLDYVNNGETIIVTFTQMMNLQGGHYLLALGCTGYQLDNLVVYHRLYDICNIEVLSNKNTIGFYDMSSKISYLN